MRKRLLWNNGIKILFLAIFTGYVGVFAFYSHIHVIGGITIVHAHPFKKAAPGQPFHEHTQAEFQLIDSLSSLNTGEKPGNQF